MDPSLPTDLPPDRWLRLRRLLDQALDEPDQRAALLATLRAEDPALCSALESLLAEHEEVGVEVAATEGATEFPAANPLTGQRVGAYQIVKEIGRGGMGTVFLAVRAEDDVQVPFALKILRQGVLAEQSEKAFQRERQMLALLDHPGIARLVDWGTIPGGLLYLVLEYVDGLPVTAFCSRHELPLIARLDLFLQVCAAVEHAHQRLVVHRDLKPSNILVPENRHVKLLDFGIAARLDAASMNTTLRLTPAYSSPEQLLGSPVTVAADIYSLGVLLYEMLTGRLPYEKESVEAVLSEQPSPPSQRTMHLPAAAVPRKELAGDLDAIVLKALRKEPDRRYPSVEQMAADIRRSQAGQPVSAVPDTRRYRINRFVRRHRLVLALSVLALGSLLGGTSVALWRWRVAETRIEQVQGFAETVIQGIYGKDFVSRGLIQSQTSVPQQGQIEPVQKSALQRREGDNLEMEIAVAYQLLGAFQASQTGPSSGNDLALETIFKGQKIFLSQWGAHPDKVRGNWLIGSYASVGRFSSDSSDAVDYLAHAKPVCEWLSGHYPNDLEVVDSCADLAIVEGNRFRMLGDLKESLASFRRAVKLTTAWLDANAPTTYSRPLYILEQARFDEASLLRMKGELDHALAPIESLSRFELSGFKLQMTRQLAIKSFVAADILRKMKSYAKAVTYAQDSVMQLEKAFGSRPSGLAGNSLAAAYFVLGECQFDDGKLKEAVASHGKALEVRIQLAQSEPKNANYQELYARSLNRSAQLLLAMGGDLSNASGRVGTALHALAQIPDASNIYARAEVARANRLYAEIAMRRGQAAQELNTLKTSADIWRYVRKFNPEDVELVPEAEEAERAYGKLRAASLEP